MCVTQCAGERKQGSAAPRRGSIGGPSAGKYPPSPLEGEVPSEGKDCEGTQSSPTLKWKVVEGGIFTLQQLESRNT